jgi:hypothetical protein
MTQVRALLLAMSADGSEYEGCIALTSALI